MHARRFILDISEKGDVILTAQPTTRFDPPPTLVKGGPAPGIQAEVFFAERKFTITVASIDLNSEV